MSEGVFKVAIICFTIICVFYMMTRYMIAEVEQNSKKSFEEEEKENENDNIDEKGDNQC